MAQARQGIHAVAAGASFIKAPHIEDPARRHLRLRGFEQGCLHLNFALPINPPYPEWSLASSVHNGGAACLDVPHRKKHLSQSTVIAIPARPAGLPPTVGDLSSHHRIRQVNLNFFNEFRVAAEVLGLMSLGEQCLVLRSPLGQEKPAACGDLHSSSRAQVAVCFPQESQVDRKSAYRLRIVVIRQILVLNFEIAMKKAMLFPSRAPDANGDAAVG